MEKLSFASNTYFDKDIFNFLLEELSHKGLSKPLIVSKEEYISLKETHKMLDLFKKYQISYQTLLSDKVKEYSEEEVLRGLSIIQDNNLDCIIVLGDDFNISYSKLLSLKCTNSNYSCENNPISTTKGLPLFIVPVTCFSSFMANSSFIGYTKDNVKRVFSDSNATAVSLLIGYDLIRENSKNVDDSEIIVSLSNAIESYLNKKASTFTSVLALNSISIFNTFVPKYIKEKNNYEYLEKVSYCSYLASLAMNENNNVLASTIARAISSVTKFNYVDGMRSILSNTLEFNKTKCSKRLFDICVAMNISIVGLTNEQGADKAINHIQTLVKSLGNKTLRKLTEEEIQLIGKLAYTDSAIKNNPKDVSVDDIIAIVKKSI